MRKLLFLFVVVLMGVQTFAQNTKKAQVDTFYFTKPTADDGTSVLLNTDNAGEHWLGHNMAVKEYLFEHRYTYKEGATKDAPGEKTVVKKEVIYDAYKKLDKYYKKKFKKGELTQTQAEQIVGDLLDKLMAICDQNTWKLEKALKKAETPEEMEAVFARIILRDVEMPK
jgi:hypothetical protein